MWGNSSRKICPFLSCAPFAEESLVFFLSTICHWETITSQTTQKMDAHDNQEGYIHRLHSCSMTACVNQNRSKQNIWMDYVDTFCGGINILCWTHTSDNDVSHHVLLEERRLSTNHLVAESFISYVERVRQTLTFLHHDLHEKWHLGNLFISLHS